MTTNYLRDIFFDMNDRLRKKVAPQPDWSYWRTQSSVNRHLAILLISGIDPRRADELQQPDFQRRMERQDGHGLSAWGALTDKQRQLFEVVQSAFASLPNVELSWCDWAKEAKRLQLLSADIPDSPLSYAEYQAEQVLHRIFQQPPKPPWTIHLQAKVERLNDSLGPVGTLQALLQELDVERQPDWDCCKWLRNELSICYVVENQQFSAPKTQQTLGEWITELSTTNSNQEQPKIKPRQFQQEEAILNAIKSLGYEPTQLPHRVPGKRGVKAEVRAKLPKLSNKVFDLAWERLRNQKQIGEEARSTPSK